MYIKIKDDLEMSYYDYTRYPDVTDNMLNYSGKKLVVTSTITLPGRPIFYSEGWNWGLNTIDNLSLLNILWDA